MTSTFLKFAFLSLLRTSPEISLLGGGAFLPDTGVGGGAEGAGARRATETEVALSPPIAAVKPGA